MEQYNSGSGPSDFNNQKYDSGSFAATNTGAPFKVQLGMSLKDTLS